VNLSAVRVSQRTQRLTHPLRDALLSLLVMPKRLAHLDRRTPMALLSVFAVLAALAGCGGGAKSTKSSTTHARSSPAATTTTAQAAGGGATVTTGPVRASLSGPDHSPVAGKLWPYSVKVTDASGKPLAGTVDTEFTFAGQVVGRESPPTHRLVNGMLHDMVTFPPQSVGEPVSLQVVVHTRFGSVTLDWPVAPRR
jgi:hypothetical protein